MLLSKKEKQIGPLQSSVILYPKGKANKKAFPLGHNVSTMTKATMENVAVVCFHVSYSFDILWPMEVPPYTTSPHP